MTVESKDKKSTFKVTDDGKMVTFSAPSSFVSIEEIEEIIDEIIERREASNPEFQKSLQESMESGPFIPWKEMKDKLSIDCT